MDENKQPTWEELVEKSEGKMVFVPEDMAQKAEDFQKATDEFLAKAKEFDKIQQDYDVAAKNFWHQMRQSIEKNFGRSDIYGKTIGWNQMAKTDGKSIINILENNQ